VEDGVALDVLVEGDTVLRWNVVGMPTPRLARPHFAWSQAQARGFPQRVIEYLAERPEVEARTAFLLFRGCPQPGTPAVALRASWGAPTEVVVRPDTTLWVYGFGVEGQHESIAIVPDTVKAYR
jgi:hypothetical protein